MIGTGPQEAELRQRFPDAKFLGLLENGKLSGHLAAADVFVFPSRTDTFGVVQLEALACGVPVAAFPVTGPKDVIGSNPIGALNEDLAGGLSRCAENVPGGLSRLCAWRIPGRTARGSSSDTSARIVTGQRRRIAAAFGRRGNGTRLVHSPSISKPATAQERARP